MELITLRRLELFYRKLKSKFATIAETDSVKTLLNNFISTTNDSLNQKVDKQSGYSLVKNSDIAQITTNKNAINVLNGNGEGSVSKAVADEIAKVVANAPSDFDTLKEVSDWIGNHKKDASAMNSAIQENAADITSLGQELNGKANKATTLSGYGITDGAIFSTLRGNEDLNNIKTVGFYNAAGSNSRTLQNLPDGIPQTTGIGLKVARIGGGEYYEQTLVITNGVTYRRICYNNTWRAWEVVNYADAYTKAEADSLLNAKANTSSLAKVATSGSYNDLANKPTIPDISGKADRTELSNYLPLSGGRMTGSIKVNDMGNRPAVCCLNDSEKVYISGGSGYVTGGTVRLFGNDSTSYAGEAQLCAQALAGAKRITIAPDGTTSAPTPATDDNSTKIATTEFVKNQNYLTEHQDVSGKYDKSGGDITGSYIQRDVADASLIVRGGHGGLHGGYIVLYGDEYSGDEGKAGGFRIATSKNGVTTGQSILEGSHDGALKWGDKYVMCSKTINIDTTGFSRDRVQSFFQICGGVDTSDGSSLTLGGEENTNTTAPLGSINLTARNSTDGEKSLLLKPDGTFTWNGKNVVLQTRTTDSSNTVIYGGTTANATGGGWISLSGKDRSSFPNSFRIGSTDNRASFVLMGDQDGNLTWRGNAVLTHSKITSNSNGFCMGDATSSYMVLNGATTTSDGASIILTGKDYTTGSTSAGTANISAYDETNGRKSLLLKPSGSITWDGRKVVLASNADNTTNTIIYGGTESTSNGSWIALYGKNFASTPAYAGAFRIAARDGSVSASKILMGKPDGTLTWDGKKVLTEGDIALAEEVSW